MAGKPRRASSHTLDLAKRLAGSSRIAEALVAAEAEVAELTAARDANRRPFVVPVPV